MVLTSVLALTLSLGSAHAAGGPDVIEPLRTGQRAASDAAVVIGIENYPFVSNVPHAARDAQAMYNFLVYTRGVPADRVRLLDRGANREQILEAVTNAGKMVGKDGTVWVFFAGHGAADTATGARLLLGDDVRQDAAAFAARGVSVDQIKDLAGKGGGSVYMLVDACYAGVGRDGGELLAGKRFLVPAYAGAANPRTLEWNAAGPNQLSGPIEAVRHGAFTYFAVGALRGWADGQLDGVRDGKVTAEEAKLYVNASLRTLQLTEQESQLSATDPSRMVLSASDKLEAGPSSSAVAALREKPGAKPGMAAAPAVPAGPLDINDRATVTAWLDGLVRQCFTLHADGDPTLRRWSIRFRVHNKRGFGGLIMNADDQVGGEYSSAATAMFTCLRNEVRGREFSLPSRAVTYSNAFNVPADMAKAPAPAPAPAPAAAPTDPRVGQPTPGDAPADVRITAPGVDVTMRVPGVTVHGSPPPTAAPAPAPQPVAAMVKVILRNPGNVWTDVRVNGKVEASFRNERELSITVKPGVHTVEFVQFMQSDPFGAGRLVTGEATEIIFGIEEGPRVVVYNHDGWQAR